MKNIKKFLVLFLLKWKNPYNMVAKHNNAWPPYMIILLKLFTKSNDFIIILLS